MVGWGAMAAAKNGQQSVSRTGRPVSGVAEMSAFFHSSSGTRFDGPLIESRRATGYVIIRQALASPYPAFYPRSGAARWTAGEP